MDTQTKEPYVYIYIMYIGFVSKVDLFYHVDHRVICGMPTIMEYY